MTTQPLDTEIQIRPPLPFHRLAHDHSDSARWWRPLAILAVSLGLYAGFMVILLVQFVVAALVTPQSWRPSELLEDPTNPADILLMLGMLAAIVPAVVLGSRWGGHMRGAIHSIAGRVRWRMMSRAALVVMPIYALILGGAYALSPPTDFEIPSDFTRIGVVLVLVLLLTPLQCAAEEYAFRALPQQALGTWLRSPVWGIVLPVPLFMVGHGYDWVGQIDIAVFALCMGFLVFKSGGVELAIVAHTANNLPIMLLAPFSATSLQQGAIPPSALLLSVPMTLAVTAGLTIWVSRTHGLRFMEPLRSHTATAQVHSASVAHTG